MKKVIIVGAGPAGLTAAFELIKTKEFKPIVLEMENFVGGISRTIDWKGNKLDIGGHRFYSESEEILKWWLDIAPLKKNALAEPDCGPLMLEKERRSSIFFNHTLIDYPLAFNLEFFKALGVKRSVKVVRDFLISRLMNNAPADNLRDFFISRFGRELYEIFFKDYTSKVWGLPPASIVSDWGRQRIGSVSLKSVIKDGFFSTFNRFGFFNKKTPRTLIKRFYYPEYGPGQLWEEVTGRIIAGGGDINKRHMVTGFELKGSKIESVRVKDLEEGTTKIVRGDYFVSSMPIKYLIRGFTSNPPLSVKGVSELLCYRDFILVGMTVKNIGFKQRSGRIKTIKDNWIYIQDKTIKIGRIQIFNNWSGSLVADKNTKLLGVEFFCNKADPLWSMPDDELVETAKKELLKTGFVGKHDFIEGMAVRVPKAYPVYNETYKELSRVREYTDKIKNLFLVGRNGMHRYNNMDHSMLTAIEAVKNIKNNIWDKDNIWKVNC